jgi:hypothetical protein
MKTTNQITASPLGRLMLHAICRVRSPRHLAWYSQGILRELNSGAEKPALRAGRYGFRPALVVVRLLAAVALTLSTPVITQLRAVTCDPYDLDQDGISDYVEQMLIERHAPFLRYDARNEVWPASPLWYVAHSALRYTKAVDNAIGRCGVHLEVLSQYQLAADPSLVLRQIIPAEFPDTCGGFPVTNGGRAEASSYLCTSDSTGFRLVPDQSVYRGIAPSDFVRDGRANLGMFAHVFRNPESPDTSIIIQYMQFFPFNDWDPGSAGPSIDDVGDHEGD